MNGIIPELFDGIKGFNKNTLLNTGDLFFDDSKVQNDLVTQFNGGAAFIIIIIILFTFIVIYSSIKLWSQKRKA